MLMHTALKIIISILVMAGVGGLFTSFVLIIKNDQFYWKWLTGTCIIWGIITYLLLSL